MNLEFPVCPVVEIPCFHCREHGFNPWLGKFHIQYSVGKKRLFIFLVLLIFLCNCFWESFIIFKNNCNSHNINLNIWRQGGKERSEKMGAIRSWAVKPVTQGSSEPVLCPSPQRHRLTLLSSQLPFCSLYSSGWFCASLLCPQPSPQAVHRDFQYLLGNDPFGDDYSHGACGQQNREAGISVPSEPLKCRSFSFF